MRTKTAILWGLGLLLLAVMLASAATGEISVGFGETLAALVGQGSDYNQSLIRNLRLPRILAGAGIGAALGLSGLLTATALRNPLADSGILGIQSGATVGALIALLAFPSLAPFLPIFAFVGGFAAFALLMMVSATVSGFRPSSVILVGVASNALCTSLVGVITLLNVYRVRDAMSWLNGSLAAVSREHMTVILIYTAVFVFVAILLLPALRLLLLDDGGIVNLGHNPMLLRVLVSVVAVFLAGIAVAYAGIISFIGIIAPQIARRLVGQGFSWLFPATALTGALLVVSTDLLQRAILAPLEIPVGILIGVLGAPVFLLLGRRL